MKFSYEKSTREGCNSVEMQIMDGNRVLAYAMNQYNAERIVAKLNELVGAKQVVKQVSQEGSALDLLARSLYAELKSCVKFVQKHGTEPQLGKINAVIKKAERMFKKGEENESTE